MENQVKSEIRKIVKRQGSHLGVVKRIISENFNDINFDDYKEFTISLIDKKMKNTKSTIRASVRFSN